MYEGVYCQPINLLDELNYGFNNVIHA